MADKEFTDKREGELEQAVVYAAWRAGMDTAGKSGKELIDELFDSATFEGAEVPFAEFDGVPIEASFLFNEKSILKIHEPGTGDTYGAVSVSIPTEEALELVGQTVHVTLSVKPDGGLDSLAAAKRREAGLAGKSVKDAKKRSEQSR